ncbi:MAG: nitrogen fixation protein NifQ [Halothiobacillaceae bacterium]|nr:nitrogen fixation protein NifQ [Halothiobacillaceae bacterium]
MSDADLLLRREELQQRILAHARGQANDALLAKMLASNALGLGELPSDLGLGMAGFAAMLERHFPGLRWSLEDDARHADRYAELEELVALMLEHVATPDIEVVAMARIVAAACMGGNHLWEDLGLWKRADLTELMTRNFPVLAEKNNRDMKWKKFLYKQLCLREGIYICRAPSCEVCADYAKCFEPKE